MRLKTSRQEKRKWVKFNKLLPVLFNTVKVQLIENIMFQLK